MRDIEKAERKNLSNWLRNSVSDEYDEEKN